jgi:hypothetical protein
MKKKENMNIFVLLKKNVCQNENEGKHEKVEINDFLGEKVKKEEEK